MSAPTVVWVTIGVPAPTVYHLRRECYGSAESRIPTLRPEAERAGARPCSRCANPNDSASAAGEDGRR